MQAHDSPLDFVATEAELIVTGNRAPRPMGVDWDRVQPDQFETIPFLSELRDRMVARTQAGMMQINDPADRRRGARRPSTRYEAALLGQRQCDAADGMFLDASRHGALRHRREPATAIAEIRGLPRAARRPFEPDARAIR